MDWEDLSTSEIRARLVNRGVDRAEADFWARHPERFWDQIEYVLSGK